MNFIKNIILKCLEAPLKQIAQNCELDGGVIINNILSNPNPNFGFDAYTETYVDMIEAGIIDPTKVTLSALRNASSVAKTLLSTEVIVVEKEEKTKC